MLFIILLVILIIGLIISATCYGHLVKVYKNYAKVESEVGLTAWDLSQKIIKHYNLKTTMGLVEGELTDAYIVKHDKIYLSERVATGTSVADISVACHEIGHAMQNNEKSGLLAVDMLFSVLKKIANFFMPIVLISAIVLLFFPNYINYAIILFNVFFGLYIVTFLFKIILIPVELDASKRAYKILKENNIFNKEELKGCKKVLNAAALTYVGAIFMNIYKIWLSIKKSFRRD